jgi:hypothetical protein
MVILFDQYNLPENIYEIIFSTGQQEIVASMLVKFIKEKKGAVTKPEMSQFAKDLHDGKIVYQGNKISYNKRQFYDRILTPMKAMGVIHYDMYNRTYSVSKNFHKALYAIAELWLQEYAKTV